jgi:hypothetical protein
MIALGKIKRIDENTVSAPCRLCKKEISIPATESQMSAWINGDYIQNSLTDATPAQREVLISGTCDDCWKKLFR